MVAVLLGSGPLAGMDFAPAAAAVASVETLGSLSASAYVHNAVWDGQAVYILGSPVQRFSPSEGSKTMGAVVGASAAAWIAPYAYGFGSGVVRRYDPRTDVMSQLSLALPEGTSWSAVAAGDVAYVFGHSTIARFDPTTNTVKRMTTTLPNFQYFTAAWDGRNVYIFGAEPTSSYGDKIFRFDPVADKLDMLEARMPSVCSYQTALWDGVHILVIGGGCIGGYSDRVRRFNPVTHDVDSVGTRLPIALCCHDAVWTGEAALIFGGNQPNGALNVFRFTPNKAPVASIASIPVSECSSGVASVRLDGSPSSDANADALRYAWDATTVLLDNASAPQPSGAFPLGVTGVSLTVRDDEFEATTSALVKVIDTGLPHTEATVSGDFGNGWWRGPMSVTLTATDTCAPGPTQLSVDGGAFRLDGGETLYTDGLHTLSFFSTDVSGNREPVQSLEIPIDGTPPATRAILSGLPGGDEWWRSAVDITLDAHDAASGVARVSHEIDGDAAGEGGALRVAGDGLHTVRFHAEDLAGNAEGEQSVAFRIDATAPVSTSAFSGLQGENGWWRSDVEAAIAASDDGSGVRSTFLRVDGRSTVEGTTAMLTGDGEHRLEFQSSDRAGNLELVRAAEVRIDHVAPVTQALLSGTSGDNGWWRSSVVVSLAASDGGSGVEVTRFRVDAGESRVGTEVTVAGDGDHVVEFSSQDAAGNAEALQTVAFRIDTAAPDVDLTDPLEGSVYVNDAPLPLPALPRTIVVGDVTVGALADDATSGVHRVEFLVDGVLRAMDGEAPYTFAWTASAEAAGAHLVEVRAVDAAGNTAMLDRKVLTVPTRPDGVLATVPPCGPPLQGNVCGALEDSGSRSPLPMVAAIGLPEATVSQPSPPEPLAEDRHVQAR